MNFDEKERKRNQIRQVLLEKLAITSLKDIPIGQSQISQIDPG
jgi:hypothetical protein